MAKKGTELDGKPGSKEARKRYRAVLMGILDPTEIQGLGGKGSKKLVLLAKMVRGETLTDLEELQAMACLGEDLFRRVYDRIQILRLRIKQPKMMDSLIKASSRGVPSATTRVLDILKVDGGGEPTRETRTVAEQKRELDRAAKAAGYKLGEEWGKLVPLRGAKKIPEVADGDQGGGDKDLGNRDAAAHG